MRRFFTWKVALAALILSAYAPFFGSRFVRTTGDEKVYVSQAVEMARDGRWFGQTLQDSPDYYKGPLHYILIRVGMGVFGYSPWAILYMNLLFLFVGAFSLGALVRRRYPDWPSGALWAGTAFAFCVGIYAHSFASQMEIELAGLFALALYLLDRTQVGGGGFWFWTVAAIAGWVKAPLHSAFLGISALIFWGFSGELLIRARNPKAWACALWGVALCVIGYIPAYLGDSENFLSLYLWKEIYEKSTTHQAAHIPIVSTFGFYLFPWVLLSFAAYLYLLLSPVRALSDKPFRRAIALVVSFCAPSVCFFLWHPYRFENYNLPVISGVLFLTAIMMAELRSSKFWSIALGTLVRITALLFLGLPVLVTAAVWRFSPMPEWWPGWILPVVCAGSLLAASGWWFSASWRGGGVRLDRLAWSTLGIYIALGSFFMVVGERELVDLNRMLRNPGVPERISYVNLQRNIWSEWGILRFFIGRPVEGKHTPEALKEAVFRGDLILVAHGEGRETFDRFVREHLPNERFNERIWKRWRTHGATDSGQPLWREAWDRRDLALFERDYYLITLRR